MTPLSLQLKATAKVVAFVMSGRSLTDVLADGSVIKPDLRPAVQAQSFAVLRNYGMARQLRQLLAPRQPAPPVDALLCTALALLVSEEGSGANYSEFTLVNQAVEAAKDYAKTRSSTSFVNATLRRFLRERVNLTNQASQNEEAQHNHPQWWIDRMRQERPNDWEAILAANQIKPALTLRVNLARTTLTAYKDSLTNQGVAWHDRLLPAFQATQNMDCGLILQEAQAVENLYGYAEGIFSVQDLAAQGAASQLLDTSYLSSLVQRAKLGHRVRVLDACAAPGGKTTHLIERLLKAFADAGMSVVTGDDWGKYFEVIALEVDAKRARRIHENLSRLKQRAIVKVVDASRLDSWWDSEPFDAVLIDAPCTASGIVRRHPDVRWLRQASDLQRLAKVQLALLNALWPVVRNGGRLLYATCSVFQAEGDAVVKNFLQANPAANKLDSHGLWIPAMPQPLTDGFYDALFEKTAH